MLNPDFLFDQVATIQNYEGYGLSGEKLGEPYPLPCRIEMSRKRVTSQQTQGGSLQEVVANARAFFPAGTRVEPNSHVTIEGRTYSLLTLAPQRGFFEESHVEAMLL